MNNIVFALLLSIMMTLVHSQKPNVYEYAIVGGGLAGLGAAKKLNEKGIEHVLIEANSYIGGRVASISLNGFEFQKGHHFLYGYEAKQLTETMGSILFSDAEYKYTSMLDKNISRARYPAFSNSDQKMLEQFKYFTKGYTDTLNHDVSLKTVWDQFVLSKGTALDSDTRDKVYMFLLIEGLHQGSTPEYMSAKYIPNIRSLEPSFKKPTNQFRDVLEQYKQKLTKTTFILNTPIKLITHGSQGNGVLTLHSDGKVIFAKKIICAVSLGVLKSGFIKFEPPLPDAYTDAINKIGLGQQEKIFVQLDSSDNSKILPDDRVLHFMPKIGQTNKCLACYINRRDNLVLECFVEPGTTKDELIVQLNSYLGTTPNSAIVRTAGPTTWKEQPYAKGAFSYYAVNTTPEHFQTLRKPIGNLYFAGEHTSHDLQVSTSEALQQGAFTGGYARVSASLSGQYLVLSLLALLIMIMI